MCRLMYVFGCLMVGGLVAGCGDNGATEADRIGVGAECTASVECESPDEEIELQCLEQFKGGYCGLEGCTVDADCPDGSACVTHDDGTGLENYCFRVCLDKPECNQNRTEENWSNCSANVEFVEERNERKACVPPSSGE